MATATEKHTAATRRLDEGESPLPSTPPKETGRSARRILTLAVLIAIVSAVAYGSSRLLGTDAGETGPSMSTYEVHPGQLLITVTEDGNVESASNIDVKCEVAGGSSILWIVEDGTEVAKGDKLVQLDSSALEDEINAQRITYNKAKSTVIQAQKDYEVAQIAVKEYLEGTFKQSLQDADAQIVISEENLRSAKNSLDYSERMFQRGYISSLELESQQFAVQRAQLELDSAKTAREVLVKFTKEKTVQELTSAVETAKAALESEQAAFELEESKLKRLETQLKACTIYAPQDGMVVYANERGRFGQQSSAIEEGAAVRDRQTILRLPDLSQMQVKVKVHETKVDQLRPNMRARIKIQDREFRGVVTSIANQPEGTSFFQGNVKEYATIVRIEGEPTGLRPGMTAEVEILVADLKDVLMLPVSAVVEQRGQYFCWVHTPQGAVQRRPLVLGRTNDQFVEIKDGVAEGDLVIRNPRAVVAQARAEVLDRGSTDVKKDFGDVPPASSSSSDARGPDTGPGQGPGGGPGAARGAGGPQAMGGAAATGSRSGSGGLMRLDKDGDGKVSKDEAPAPMRPFFDQVDSNGDGFVDRKEAQQMRGRGRPNGRPRGGGPDGPAGAGGPRRAGPQPQDPGGQRRGGPGR